MKASRKLLLASTALLVPTLGWAADLTPQPAAPAAGWADWYLNGALEFGGQAFIQKPGDYPNTNNNFKFNEYGDRTWPGFLDFIHLGAGSKDGLYQVDLYGKNVGQNDQEYLAQASKAGEQYFNFEWNSTPHFYGETQTVFGGVGTSNITVNPAMASAINFALFNPNPALNHFNTGTTSNAASNPGQVLFSNPANGTQFQPWGCYLANQVGTTSCLQGGVAATPVQTTINNNLQSTALGIQRDRATFEYRYTPTPDWDVKFAYSDEHRSGTQELGVLFGSAGTGAPAANVPFTISDHTQDATVSGEWAGFSPWNQRMTLNLRYNASIYNDDMSEVLVQSPFGGPANGPSQGCATAATINCTALAGMSTPPNNWASTITAMTGMDLPYNSRYMGTFSFNEMMQNAAFIPMTVNSASLIGGLAAGAAIPTAPRSSLEGDINTLLFNNTVTTQFNADWSNRANYRYYSNQNNTPALTLTSWVVNDSAIASGASSSVGSGGYAPHTTQFSSYVRQNFSDDVTWRPIKEAHVGLGYAWENYDRSLTDVNTTNENTVKGFADYTPAEWMTIRTSGSFSARRYDNYSYQNYVADITSMGATTSQSILGGLLSGTYYTGGLSENPLLRIYDYANRDRTVGKVWIDFNPIQNVTITPYAGIRWDDYPTDALINNAALNQLGLTADHNWNAGVEASYALNKATTFTASYDFESSDRNLIGTATGASCVTAATGCAVNMYDSDMAEKTHTVMAAVNFDVIPDRLSMKFSYTFVYADDSWATSPFGMNCTGTSCLNGVNIVGQAFAGSNPAYPDYTSTLNRFDATAKYLIDPQVTAGLGWKGETFIKLRYLYEQNNVNNWQYSNLQSYMYQVTNSTTDALGKYIYLPGQNPSYTAQAIIATVGAKW